MDPNMNALSTANDNLKVIDATQGTCERERERVKLLSLVLKREHTYYQVMMHLQ